MNKKKKIIFIVILVVCIIVIGGLIWYFIKDIPFSKEERLVNKLTSMGEEIYTEYYYPTVTEGETEEEIASFLSAFAETGLKFNLNNLENYSDEFSEEVANFKNGSEECDKENTMVIIYPVEPYGETDYTIDIKLNCGF